MGLSLYGEPVPRAPGDAARPLSASPRDYHRRVPLTLLAGPAHAGKVALLLERYLEALPHEPVLIVPNAPDVERVERDLLRRAGALLGGSIVTFDDLFRQIAGASPDARPVLGELQRALAVRRAVERVELDGLAPSARFGGFADALGAALAELENGLVEPEEAPGELRRSIRIIRRRSRRRRRIIIIR